MKKYTILGHIFELDDRAHDFLANYITRIENYAQNNTISSDILEDIKYNIIEKLYQSSIPINESYVMNLAQTIGEPEEIFENKNDENNDTKPNSSNILNRRFGKQKPMIRGVCYWIASSLNIPVSIVRLIFLVAVFIYGTSIWLYPLLALFVPFQDKKSTTGQTGNLFFELIRIIIWLGVIFLLGSAILGTIFGIVVFTGMPPLSNQSIQTLMPSLYPLLGVGLVALIILFIGSIGALIKKTRVSKVWAMVCMVLIVAVGLGAAMSGYNEFRKYNYNTPTIEKQMIEQSIITGDTIIINLNGEPIKHYNYLADFFGDDFNQHGIFQHIQLIASDTDEVKVEVMDQFNIIDSKFKQTFLSKRSQVQAHISGNTVTLDIPNDIFTEKVAFVFAERTINIYIPTDKFIQYNNNTNVRYRTPNVWHDRTQGDEKMIYCEDTTSFKYYPSLESRRCANTSSSPVNQYTDYDQDDYYTQDLEDVIDDHIDTQMDNLDDHIENIIDMSNLTPDQEDTLTAIYKGLTISQAQALAKSKGHLFRIVEQNGRELPRTEDYRPGRINAEIHNGVIIDIDIE